MNKFFKTRIHPIISGKVRPKLIVNEAGNIISQSEKIIFQFDGFFNKIFGVKRRICAKGKKGELMDLKSFIDILIVSFLIINFFLEK